MVLNDYFFFYFLLFPFLLATMCQPIFILKHLKHISTNEQINGNLHAASQSHTILCLIVKQMYFILIEESLLKN